MDGRTGRGKVCDLPAAFVKDVRGAHGAQIANKENAQGMPTEAGPRTQPKPPTRKTPLPLRYPYTMIPLIAQHSEQLTEICRRHHVKRLELFGSAAGGDFNHQTSDIDFLVDYHPFRGPGKADAYFGLLEDLQELFDRPVDLVVDRAIENPYFRKSVDSSKVPVYES